MGKGMREPHVLVLGRGRDGNIPSLFDITPAKTLDRIRSEKDEYGSAGMSGSSIGTLHRDMQMRS
jgi:hypothetical protein